jgi:hypothetical protein
MSKLSIIIGAVALAGLAAALLLERQAQTRLRQQNEALRQKVRQLAQLGAESQPAVAPTTRKSPPAGQSMEVLRLRGEVGVRRQEKAELGQLQADNRRLRAKSHEQLLEGKKLTLEQVAPYLAAKQRNAESLLAAFRLTGDQSLLREAGEKYPNDPRVLLAAFFEFRNELSSPDRRQLLDAFKQSAPDNALANYLSAQAYFKAGQPDLAVQELAAAAGKPQLQDYTGDLVQSAEAAYRAAGLTSLEAMRVALATVPLPQLAELRGLGESLGKLATQYRQAGDEASAQAALQMGVALGRRVGEASGPSTVIQTLVGIAVERKILDAMDPASPYDTAGHTVKDRLDELAGQRQTIRQLAGSASESVLQTLPEQDQLAFYERVKASGELAAWRWLANRQAKR